MNRGLSTIVGLVCTLAGCGLELGGSLAADTDASAHDGSILDAEPRDGGVAPDGSLDAGPDADAHDEAPPPTSVVIAPAGTISSPTGLAQQHHVIYAVHSTRYWLFTLDSAAPLAVGTWSSPDFVTWTAGASLVLPLSHAGVGGNLSVDYADVGGLDIVHLTIGVHGAGNDHHRLHSRAVVAGATILFGSLSEIDVANDSALVDPDGASTTIGTDGRVVDSSGWATAFVGGGTGNESAWQSLGVENGTSWPPSWSSQQDIALGQHTVNARAVVGLGSGNLIAVWEAADMEPNPTYLGWSRWNGIAWSLPGSVFTNSPQSANDWDVCRISDIDVHAVRRTIAGAYEHVRYNGTFWNAGQTIPPNPGKTGGGVVLLTDGTKVMLATIAGDLASSVRTVEWAAGVWGTWRTVESAPVSRSYLSGWAGGGHAALVWTQPNGAMFDVAGATVSF